MLKKSVYERLKDSLGKYLFGFDEEQLDVGLFSGNINLRDLILKPDKVNALLEEADSPFQLKAGLISKVNMKVGLLAMHHL